MDSTPAELWTEILHHLRQRDLPSIMLANRTFAQLGRPLLFRHFEFTPYATVAPQQFFLPAPRALRWASERLDFWASDRIAPLVRTCVLSPQRPVAAHRLDQDGKPRYVAVTADEAVVLLDNFIQNLAKFSRTMSFTMMSLPLTNNTLASIYHSLPQLRELCLCFSTPLPDTSSLGFEIRGSGPKIEALNLWSDAAETGESLGSLHAISSFFNPKHLKHLELLGSWTTGAEKLPHLPLLSHCTLEFTNLAAPNFYAELFSKFLAIEWLRVSWVRGEEPGTPPAAIFDKRQSWLRSIKCLHVSNHVLPAFLASTDNATELNISGSTPITDIVTNLRDVRAPHITTLLLSGEIPAFAALELSEVIASFPRLVHLSVTVRYFDVHHEPDVHPVDRTVRILGPHLAYSLHRSSCTQTIAKLFLGALAKSPFDPRHSSS
uniref:F-box domain-containing protein n=1 Tax=Mycena chlorophos TaxID=658473 RepID=A0ABQ0L1V7_MYCCL|nr:predicted protein [Mycena chlorophos]